VTSLAAPTNVISKQLAFCYCIALKEDGDSLFVLGHHRGLPASSTSLVQEIGEGIFILSRVPSQLDHHSLVFFHQELEIRSR
jgi:tRNA pseudouridine-54 N-methylase